MGLLTRVLFLVLGLRLLMPHGVCVCHLLDRQARPVAPEDVRSTPEEEEDDHPPSCPASKTAGDYVCNPDCDLPAPPSLPGMLALPGPCLFSSHPALAIPAPFPHLSEQPLYLTLRALLI